jgi:hypothetical protein
VKRKSTILLQILTVLIGIGALVFMLWEPHLEGRNVNATPFQIYFQDPFLAYAYLASIPFFLALYQAFQVLGHARKSIADDQVLRVLDDRFCRRRGNIASLERE